MLRVRRFLPPYCLVHAPRIAVTSSVRTKSTLSGGGNGAPRAPAGPGWGPLKRFELKRRKGLAVFKSRLPQRRTCLHTMNES